MKIIEPKMEVEKFDGKAIMKRLERACRTCYRSEGSITDESYKTVLNNCITRGHESILEHEKITIRMTCDIGVYKDLTRHRIASFSVESTRYCNYGKDKFDNEIKVMILILNYMNIGLLRWNKLKKNILLCLKKALLLIN